MISRTRLHLCVLALALSLLGACAGVSSKPWVRETLYFGLSRPGGTVSEAQWQAFVDEEATPRFPDGLTHWKAEGQWRAKDGKVLREQSRILQILHPGGGEAEARVEALRAAYRMKFEQESVLRTTEELDAKF